MIAVVAPEPAPWVERLLRSPVDVLGDAGRLPAVLFAPWRMPGWRAADRVGVGRASSSEPIAGGFGNPPRVPLDIDRVVGAALGGRTGALMARRFGIRAAVDRLAALLLPRSVRLVIAPSCGALATFATAARRGIPAVLIQDLPLLRQLHADLDQAARLHPRCALLGRYRAPVWRVVRQEREQALADRILVRGTFAAEQLLERGHRVRPLPLPPPAAATGPTALARLSGGPLRLLLAGPACGRAGIEEALTATAAIAAEFPGTELLVRPGEAVEPSNLFRRPAVRLASRAEIERLAGIDVVLAPAPCESYAPEVARAAALGVPVVATRRAAGAVDLTTAGAEIEPHDAAGLHAAVLRVLSRGDLRPLTPALSPSETGRG
jgi:hypothetical protein